MLKNLFQFLEALLNALAYLMVLFMAGALAGLGAFVIGTLTYRFGQFIWDIFGKNRWLGP